MKAKTMGSGWHKESLRHSNARRLGRAGGKYSTMTYKQLKQRGVNLKPTADADKDGVPNSLDCRPLNKHAQDNGKYVAKIIKGDGSEETRTFNNQREAVLYVLDQRRFDKNIRLGDRVEEKKGFWDKVKDFKAKRAERAEQAKAEEHEARMKEIARLKEEIKELEEKKEAQRLLAKEKNELEQIRQEHNRLKYEKIKAKAERVKKFLKPVGKFLKEEARYVVKGKPQRRTKKGRSRKMKPLLDFTI